MWRAREDKRREARARLRIWRNEAGASGEPSLISDINIETAMLQRGNMITSSTLTDSCLLDTESGPTVELFLAVEIDDLGRVSSSDKGTDAKFIEYR